MTTTAMPELLLVAEKILNATASMYNVSVVSLKGRKNTKSVRFARQVAMYLLRNDGVMSFNAIGEVLNRDHSTIIYGCKELERKLETDETLQQQLHHIRLDLNKSA